ncbi:MAG: NAD-dependent epimerase/dehydratase family protein [Sandaracinaceae bacterium]
MTRLSRKIEGKALITGASGFVGRNLKRALEGAGADVITIRRPASPPAREGRSVALRYDDVDALTRLMKDEKPDWVFHVAGATNGVTYDDFVRANVMPTENLLTALREAHPSLSRFVYVSSLAAFGPSSKRQPHVETNPREPIEHYGRSKLEAEQRLEKLDGALPWTVIRPSGVYGPEDREFFLLFREIEKRRNVFYGNRKRMFSLIYIDDCVRAMVDAALSENTLGKGYFLDDGRPVDWETFQGAIIDEVGKRPFTLDVPSFVMPVAAWGGELLAKLDGKPRLLNMQKLTMGEQDAWTCSSEAAKQDFGFTPEVDMHEGIRRTRAWYREQGWFKSGPR